MDYTFLTVLDTLNLQNVILVGFSMGGAITIHYMARHQGHRISKLALLGAAAPCFTKREDFPFGIPKSAVDESYPTNLRRSTFNAQEL